MKIVVVLLSAVASLAAADNWRDQGVIYLNSTPNAVMHPVPVRSVTIRPGFWYERRRVNVERSIPTMFQLLDEHGVLDNFRRMSGRSKAPRRGPVYTDSDMYKWIEAAAFVLQSGDNPQLRADIDRAIDDIVAAQRPDGYLNTYYVDERADKRFTEMDRTHELYNLGHLLQAAIAYYRATGDRKLLDAGIRYVNFLVENFGPAKHPLLTGHPEFEMAAIELYRTTGDRRYLDIAGYLLSGVETERLHLRPSQTRYMFSGIPFTSRTEFVGHAVRAMYACSGATDYYAETGNQDYRKTLDTLWTDLTTRKMYITGGVGSREDGEAFGNAYELPNDQAYTESCAAIGNVMWNFRMLAITGQAKYADVIERALYNGANSGMSLNGTMYCYRNPLATSGGEQFRNPWYETTCCPPNLERILASLPGYMYATSRDGIYVHLYENSELNWHLEDSTPLRITQQTGYPWDGNVSVTVAPDRDLEFILHLRVPSWSAGTAVTVNGETQPSPKAGEYIAIRRRWHSGDRVDLTFDMTPRVLAANPLVSEDTGKVAVQRGPLVYCLEQPDQSAPVGDELFTRPADAFAIERKSDLLGGIVILRHAGLAYEQPLASQPLYTTLSTAAARRLTSADLRFIPYYAFANREPAAMTVWTPLK